MIKVALIETLSRYTGEQAALSLWEEIVTAYSSPERHYHNLTHLENMYRELTEVKAQINNWEATVIALCYHDIIYNAKKSDNEEQSAALVKERLQQTSFTAAYTAQVVKLVLATKAHKQENDNDVNLFTDADLSILGADETTYKSYAAGVRKEYRHVPDFLFIPGRKKVLKHFLNMPQIFKTASFRDRYEAAARNNLQRELKA